MLAAALLLLFASSAHAVVVYKKGTTQPIAGYLVREDDREVVLRQSRADGRSEDVAIAKEEIEELLHTVDPERLAALDPARPQDYREYADELAEKKLDPEARDAALRLYVIAAYVGQASRLPGADPAHAPLLGLIALARSPEEEARFRAAAYLSDPRHDSALLKVPSAIASSAAPSNPAAQRKLLDAVQQIRRGKGDVAARLIVQPDIAAELAAARAIVTKEEFLRLCRTRELDDGELKTLLTLELALETALFPPPTAASAKDAARSWSQLLAQPQPSVRPLSLAHLTEFNPRQCVYREGKWVEP
ncbi:MAG TPA: hypothetical protein VMP01_02020 [Pirellulaceae bacterium]|nr:hypothetical protein [Pirellulaceae bacterium]